MHKEQATTCTLALFFVLIGTLPAWADQLIYSDDFSSQAPEWELAVDPGYVGQYVGLNGILTQAMVDQALAGSYANISGGSLNLKANTTIGRDWGAASAILNLQLPEDFRITFSSVKTQWAGHERFKFFESDPTIPLDYTAVTRVNPDHGRMLQFGVAGSVSGDLQYEPLEDQPQQIDFARNTAHVYGHTYQYEIEKIANRFTVWRDGSLQFDYSGALTLDFLNYMGIVNLQAGATSSIDNLEIYSIPEPSTLSLVTVCSLVLLLHRFRSRHA